MPERQQKPERHGVDLLPFANPVTAPLVDDGANASNPGIAHHKQVEPFKKEKKM